MSQPQQFFLAALFVSIALIITSAILRKKVLWTVTHVYHILCTCISFLIGLIGPGHDSTSASLTGFLFMGIFFLAFWIGIIVYSRRSD